MQWFIDVTKSQKLVFEPLMTLVNPVFLLRDAALLGFHGALGMVQRILHYATHGFADLVPDYCEGHLIDPLTVLHGAHVGLEVGVADVQGETGVVRLVEYDWICAKVLREAYVDVANGPEEASPHLGIEGRQSKLGGITMQAQADGKTSQQTGHGPQQARVLMAPQGDQEEHQSLQHNNLFGGHEASACQGALSRLAVARQQCAPVLAQDGVRLFGGHAGDGGKVDGIHEGFEPFIRAGRVVLDGIELLLDRGHVEHLDERIHIFLVHSPVYVYAICRGVGGMDLLGRRGMTKDEALVAGW